LAIGILITVLISTLAIYELTNDQPPDADINENISNNNTNLAGDSNTINKTPPGPISIPLERPPFID
jgi:hypothetical protein